MGTAQHAVPEIIASFQSMLLGASPEMVVLPPWFSKPAPQDRQIQQHGHSTSILHQKTRDSLLCIDRRKLPISVACIYDLMNTTLTHQIACFFPPRSLAKLSASNSSAIRGPCRCSHSKRRHRLSSVAARRLSSLRTPARWRSPSHSEYNKR